MRLGVLDIGSNSAQLQVVDLRPGAPPLPAHAVKEPTLLGQELQSDGCLTEQGIQRACAAVARAVEAARRLEVDQLYTFATAAIRDAVNRDEVIDRITSAAAVRPEFLSGEEEARLTYHAAHRWYGWSAGRLLLLDIGGGSMEIVLGRDAEPELAVSLPLGAGRLTREFLPDDRPTQAQLKALRKHIRKALREVADRLHWEGVPSRAVGTSKTFKQLARLSGAPSRHRGPFVRRTLRTSALDAWIPRMAQMSIAERARLRGVSQPRARQILAGALVARSTMDLLGIPAVDICPWALREGIVLRHSESTSDSEIPLPLQPLAPSEEKATIRHIQARTGPVVVESAPN